MARTSWVRNWRNSQGATAGLATTRGIRTSTPVAAPHHRRDWAPRPRRRRPYPAQLHHLEGGGLGVGDDPERVVLGVGQAGEGVHQHKGRRPIRVGRGQTESQGARSRQFRSPPRCRDRHHPAPLEDPRRRPPGSVRARGAPGQADRCLACRTAPAARTTRTVPVPGTEMAPPNRSRARLPHSDTNTTVVGPSPTTW